MLLIVACRCEIKFLLAHKYKQVISGLLLSFNTHIDIEIKYLRVWLLSTIFFSFLLWYVSLFDFVKDQLEKHY